MWQMDLLYDSPCTCDVGATPMANLLSLRSATRAAPVPHPAWPTSNLRRTLSTVSDSPCLQWIPCTPAWDTQQVLLRHNRVTLYMVCNMSNTISSSCICALKRIFMWSHMLSFCLSFHNILILFFNFFMQY
jgi:hypothetical protein